MLISIDTGSYNHRRYGKPWIARVTFETAKGDFAWGEWIGSRGDSGRLEIEAQPGDVVAEGQKDMRKPDNSKLTFYLVGGNGELTQIDKTQAVDAYRTKRNAGRADTRVDDALTRINGEGAIVPAAPSVSMSDFGL